MTVFFFLFFFKEKKRKKKQYARSYIGKFRLKQVNSFTGNGLFASRIQMAFLHRQKDFQSNRVSIEFIRNKFIKIVKHVHCCILVLPLN